MSRENEEIVRCIYVAFDTGRLDAAIALIDPAVEYVNPPHAVETGTRHGIEEMLDAVTRSREAFASSAHSIERMVSRGDNVFVSVTFRATGRGSGAESEQPEAHIWTFRNGKVKRFQWFHGRDESEAFAAAGLRM